MADVADVVSTAVAAVIRAGELDTSRAGLEVLLAAVHEFTAALARGRVDVDDLLRAESVLRTEAETLDLAAMAGTAADCV